MKYFVWVKNSHGVPEAQIWHGKQTDGNGKAKETLAIHEMTEADDKMPIRELVEKYRYDQ
jgi:hypothetical protein